MEVKHDVHYQTAAGRSKASWKRSGGPTSGASEARPPLLSSPGGSVPCPLQGRTAPVPVPPPRGQLYLSQKPPGWGCLGVPVQPASVSATGPLCKCTQVSASLTKVLLRPAPGHPQVSNPQQTLGLQKPTSWPCSSLQGPDGCYLMGDKAEPPHLLLETRNCPGPDRVPTAGGLGRAHPLRDLRFCQNTSPRTLLLFPKLSARPGARASEMPGTSVALVPSPHSQKVPAKQVMTGDLQPRLPGPGCPPHLAP